MCSEDSESDSDDQELFPIPANSIKLLLVAREKKRRRIAPNTDQSGPSALDYEDPLLYAGVLGAVVEGDLEKLKTLIAKGRSPNINDNNGNTALHVAVIKNQPEIIDYLLSLEEILVNSRNFSGETPLLQAVERGNLPLLEKLINSNADVNLPDLQEIAPLHLSVNEPQIAHILIKNGANLNALDYTGETPLHYAVSSSCIEIICMLLYFNAEANIKCNANMTPFMKSIYQGKLEIQQILLDYVVDFNTATIDGQTVLLLALSHPCLCVEEIIERGADVNYIHGDLNAFRVCLSHPNVDKFRLIWNRFRPQEIKCNYPRMLLKALGEIDIYQYLRVIIDSENLIHFFEWFNDLKIFYGLVTKSKYKGSWCYIIYELVFIYLSYGYSLKENIIKSLYYLFGYNKLLYICLHMDIESKFPRPPRFRLPSPSSGSIFDFLCQPTLTMRHLVRIQSPETEVQVPSLLELARNTTRDYLVWKFKLFQSKLYVSFIDNMQVPEVIKLYLTFRKPIYIIEKKKVELE